MKGDDMEGLYKKLFDAMKGMENPTKSKEAYKYKYETLEQVLGIIRPALAKNGLMLTQCQRETESGWILETWVFDESGERVLMDSRPIPQCNDAQAQGSWETYLRRYALRTAFGLTGEDDDGEATKKTPKKPYNAPKKTEAASADLMAKINAKVDEFAGLKGKEPAEVINALMATKTMKGCKFNDLTKDKATDALMILIKWVDESKPELYDEDVEF